MAVLWVVNTCSLVKFTDVSEVLADFIITHLPDEGSSKYLRNADKFLPDYTALQPTRQPSAYSPPWEPKILQTRSALKQITEVGSLFTDILKL
jgi:hypothetical protein